MNSSLSAVQPTAVRPINRRFRAFLFLVVLWLCAPNARPAAACLPPNVSLLEMIGNSDLIVTGSFHDLREGRARFAVDQTLKGQSAPDIEIAPVLAQPQNMCDRFFRDGETDVLLLRSGAPATILNEGYGALAFSPATKKDTVEAVRRLLPLASLPAPALARAMLALATDDNPVLRAQALAFVMQLPLEREHPLRYEAELIRLLQSPAPDVKRAALYALRFRGSLRALPLAIEASRSNDAELVAAASQLLGSYDTPASVAALIALSNSQRPEFRVRALIDMGQSARPATKTALLAAWAIPSQACAWRLPRVWCRGCGAAPRPKRFPC